MKTLGTALIAGGIFATGIVIGNVEWTGEDSVNNIDGNINELEETIQDALSDNQYLTEQFNAMVTKYEDSVAEANSTIGNKDDEIATLNSTIEDLEASIADMEETAGDYEGDEEEIQAEITRLENELQEANAQVEALEQSAQEAVERNQYDGVDREAYNVDNISMSESWTLPISEEAVNVAGHEAIDYMLQPDNMENVRAWVEERADNYQYGGTAEIVGIGVSNKGNVMYEFAEETRHSHNAYITDNPIYQEFENQFGFTFSIN